jgi:eukaryotic-like serine/threonine-protein kinase
MECLGENTVADLVDALLAPEQRAAVEAHTAQCESCRRLVSELIRRSTTHRVFRPDDEPAIATGTPASTHERRHIEPGTQVGRYVVKGPLGSGAMGAVFTAFDPELDRAIALKLLHPGTSAQRDRILREARALAKLSHPNVVAAYDVGELDGDLVLAMELVDGSDLRAWSAAATRAIEEVVDVFVQAAAGLAAAHTAGLVHRDVKPANIVVGKSGRVRIVDFGLAAGPDGGTDLVGTPAYMAPEVFDGAGADAAADQFALCVSMYETIYGERPFVVNFVDDVARGLPTRTPDDRVVPARLRDVLARGLDVEPTKRFPSLDALAAALAPPRRARRSWLAAGGGVAILGTAALLVAAHSSPEAAPPPCRDVGAPFAKLWPGTRAAAIRDRFAASRAPFADAAWRTVDTALNAFGERWTAAATDSCVATRIRGTQSDQVLALRTACLDRALAEADALTGLLASADRSAIERAPAAVEALPSLAECSNTTALLAPVPPPNERDVAVVAAIADKLARGRAYRDASRWSDARTIATEAVASARAIAHDPTRAAALFLLGEAHEGAGAPREAEAALREAYAAAERGRDDLLAARTATELVFVVGQQQNRYKDGLEWAFHADSLLARAGGDLEVASRLAGDLANIRYGQANYPLARELYQKAYDLRVKVSGPNSHATARALYNVGYGAIGQGDNPAALDFTTRAIAMFEQNVGPAHPEVAHALLQLGAIQSNQGKHADALATFDRALAIAAPILGDDHPDIGRMHLLRCRVLHPLGRDDEALAACNRALPIFDRPDGDNRLLGETVTAIGDAQHALGHTDDALASYRRVLAIDEATFGKDSEEVASALESIASLDADAGRHADALSGYRAALAIRDKVDEPDYFEKAYALAGIGDAETHLGHAAAAIPSLRKAVELLAKYDGDPATLAATRLSLAIALSQAGGDTTEARSLVNAAEPALSGDAQALERLRAWKRTH